MLNAYVNVARKKIRVTPNEDQAEGETLLGTIDQNAAGPNAAVGDKDNQVLFHHVEGLMIKARLFDYAKYDIITGDAEDAPTS